MNPTDAGLLVEEANRLDWVLREHLQEGKLAEAVALARKVLSLREEVFGPEHPAVAQSLDNLGGLEYAAGARGAAAVLYGRSALLWLKALGPEHDQVGASVLNVLLLAEQAHAPSPPFSFSATALAIAQEGAALDETSATTLLNAVAGRAFNHGYLAAADELYSEVLARRERTLGPSHEDLALPIANLAAARRRRGDFRACEALLARAIAIEDGRPGGPTHMLDTYLHNRTAVLIMQERFAEAEAMARRVLELTQRRSGAGGLEEANALNSLGVILRHADKLEEAESCMRGAFAAFERLADQPAVVAKILGNLAGVVLARGRATEAESLMRRSLETLEATLGPEHIEVAGALEAVADLVRMQGRLDEAEPALRRALEIRERTQGAEHPEIVTPLQMLATVLVLRGQLGAAEPLLLRALRIVEAVHGPDELATAAVLTGLGSLYRDRGDEPLEGKRPRHLPSDGELLRPPRSGARACRGAPRREARVPRQVGHRSSQPLGELHLLGRPLAAALSWREPQRVGAGAELSVISDYRTSLTFGWRHRIRLVSHLNIYSAAHSKISSGPQFFFRREPPIQKISKADKQTCCRSLLAISSDDLLSGKGVEIGKSIASAAPSSPFAQDFQAGADGFVGLGAAIGAIAGVAIPAWTNNVKRARYMPAEVHLGEGRPTIPVGRRPRTFRWSRHARR